MKIGEILPLIEQEAKRQGINPMFAARLFHAENSADGQASGDRDPGIISPKGAVGLMQVLPSTAEALQRAGYLPSGVTLDLKKPLTNIQAGVAAAKEALDLYGGNEAAAAAHYNGGGAQGSLVAAGKAPAALETRNYLKKVGYNVAEAPNNVRTSFRLHTNGIDPGTQADLNVSLKDFISLAEETDPKQEEIAQSRVANFQSEAAAQREVGKAGADVAIQGGQIAAQKTAQGKNILAAFGIDDQAEGNALVDAQRRIIEARSQQDALKPEIDAKMAVGILDNPIEWIVNRLQLPSMIAKYNGAVSTENSLLERQTIDQAHAARQMELNPGVEKDAIMLEAAAKADDARAKAEVLAVQSQGNALTIQAQRLTERMNWSGATLQQRLGVAKALRESQMIGAGTGGTEKIPPDLELVNSLIQGVGAKPFSAAEWKDFPSTKRAAFQSFARSGAWGANPGDAFRNLDASEMLAAIARNPAKAGMADFIGKQIRAADVEMKAIQTDPQFAKLPLIQQQAMALERANAKQMEILNGDNYDLLPKTSAYRLNVFDVATDPAFNGNSIVEHFRTVKATGRAEPPDNTEIQAYAIAAGLQGVPLPQLAKELDQLYRKGMELQYAQRGMSQLGYVPIKQYPVSTTFTKDRGRRLQLWNPADIENFLMFHVSAGMAKKAIEATNGSQGRVNVITPPPDKALAIPALDYTALRR